MQYLTPGERLIFYSIKIIPNKKEIEQLNELIPVITDWNYLYTIVVERGIATLLYKKLPFLKNRLMIPEMGRATIYQTYYRTMSRSMVLYDAFRQVIEAFYSDGISVVALKGIYLSEWLYQDIGLRQMSDIDILVHGKDGLRCIDVLKELGYYPADTGETEFVRSHEEIIHYRPMIKDGVSVEVHIKLHKDAEKYHLDNETLWRNATPVTLNGVRVLALGKYDQLIHLCVHLDKHFKAGHVQFTCFMDIVNYIEKYVDDFDWSELTNSCKEYNCVEEVFKYIVLCEKYMYATVPRNVIQNNKHFLTESDEELFFRYLNGEVKVTEQHGKNVSNHIRNVEKLQFADKIRYVWDVVFPPKAFMISKYLQSQEQRARSKEPRTKNQESRLKMLKLKFWWLWYPYRWFVGLKGIIRLLFTKK